MINKRIFVLILTVFICGQLFAGIGSAAYQKLGMDARGIAMGRAVSGNSFNSSAVFWNPANLVQIPNFPGETFHMMANYMSFSEYDIQYITAAVARRWKRFGLGIGLMNYGVDDIDHYNASMDYLGSFDNIESSMFLGVAFRIPYVMNFGLTVQYLEQGFTYSGKSQSMGLKGGITMPILFYPQLVLSLAFNNRSFENFKRNQIVREEFTRPVATAGVTWMSKMSESSYLSQFVVTSEIEQEEQFPIKIKCGLEVLTVNLSDFRLYLRGGIDDIGIETRSGDFVDFVDTDIKLKELNRLNMKETFGFGLVFPAAPFINSNYVFHLDYAFVNEAFRNLHFFTMGLSIK